MEEQKNKSELDVDDFKFNLRRKREILKKLVRSPLLRPVIIYVKNKKIPDITKTVYLVFKYMSADELIAEIKGNMERQIEGKFYLQTESFEEMINGDILIEELYEDYRNRDRMMYFIFEMI
jgi:hypothetical protein